jgi:hypothetical protein
VVAPAGSETGAREEGAELRHTENRSRVHTAAKDTTGTSEIEGMYLDRMRIG